MNAWAQSAEVLAAEEAERQRYGGFSLREADRIAMTPELWARAHAFIPDRVTKQPVKLVPSILQRRMFWHYQHCQKNEIPCRECAVKIRRGGGSTGAEAIFYLHAHNHVARLGAIGTDDTASKNMFEMVCFFDEQQTFPWEEGKASKILQTGYLEWPNGSSWETYTAENPESARSAGLQGYHATEVGRWPNGGAKDAKETLRSMLGAVPRRGFTVVIEESTAKGAQGAFYDRFTGARWPTADELGVPEGKEYWRIWADETPQNIAESEAERKLQFVRVFSAWFEDDENKPETPVGPEDRERIEKSLDAKELDLIKRYRTIGPQGERLGRYAVTATLWDQLAWRRSVIRGAEFDGDVEAFEQENPSSPREAFASSGRHTFNRAGCAFMVEAAKSKVPLIGTLSRQLDGVVFTPSGVEDAWLQVWQEPREGYHYLAGLDTMGGASNVQNVDDADFNAGVILRTSVIDDQNRRLPHTVVAMLVPNRWDPDVLAERMHLLSEWYGGCMVVFEVNNTGAAFRQEAMARAMNLYVEENFDKVTGITLSKIVGWTTDKASRPLLMGTLKKHIRNNATDKDRGDGVSVMSKTIAEECQHMIVWPNGKDAAPSGKHDDFVMALGMALQCVSSATYYAARKRKRREPADRKNWKRVGRR